MRSIFILFFIGMSWIARGQQEIPLYEGEVPNSRRSDIAEQTDRGADGILRVANVTEPTLIAYLPPEGVTNTGKAVVVCPGGGYHILAIAHEGHDIAQALANNGIAAFVLKYRLPNDEIMKDKSIGPLQDAQRAIQLVRERADEWGITSNRIGVAGFSAGGHLASTLSTHYREPLIENPDGISLRPDFSLLVYPVISFREDITHKGSRSNLLGQSPTEEQIRLFSNELQVSEDTPPAFLVHAGDDAAVPIANSELYVSALEKYGVTAKLLTYPTGGHGFGLNNRTTSDKWFSHFLEWLEKL